MKSLWINSEAESFSGSDLDMRVYTSRLLGSNENLVMHGGGNTSVKSKMNDFFGNELEVLLVKGSGWDLKTIEKPGFPALRLAETQHLAELETLSDTDMASQLRFNMLDQAAPAPSVEAILHAIIPTKFVDHSHADAVLVLSNNPKGEDIIAEVFSDCLILPYVMPGFILSKQVNEAIKHIDINQFKGIILHHHGVFTYSEDPKESYENMIELVTRAEDYIQTKGVTDHGVSESKINLEDLAKIRKAVSISRGSPQLAMLDCSSDAQGYATREDVLNISTRGPITPDHVIRTKRIPVILEEKPKDDVPEIEIYAKEYRAYFERNRTENLIMLDPAPRAGVWCGNGTIAFGSTTKECNIISDIWRHTRWTIQTGESLGGWEALSESEIFELEYWSLEQAKLSKSAGIEPSHKGKIAIVTGAAGGIGKATCRSFINEGAVVIGLDINKEVLPAMEQIGAIGKICDLTKGNEVRKTIEEIILKYGGLDILVCNAGIFYSGENIEKISQDRWDKTMNINLDATRSLMANTIKYLKHGINPSIIVIGSRNYEAPGAGASAYSVSKAAVTQLARVAALELAPQGIRVNILHPDAVFDTQLWTEEALKKSAERYNLTIEEYKYKNLLGIEVTSKKVGDLVSVMASDIFSATTGAQIPIDGGNDRVI